MHLSDFIIMAQVEDVHTCGKEVAAQRYRTEGLSAVAGYDFKEDKALGHGARASLEYLPSKHACTC